LAYFEVISQYSSGGTRKTTIYLFFGYLM